MADKELSNSVLYVSWWNKVYTEPDRFIGVVRIPIASANLLEGDVFRPYQMSNMGI